MKILFINYEYPPLGGGGGSGMQEICLELGKRHEVHVVTSGREGLAATEKHPDSNVTVHRAKVFGRSARATASFISMFHFLSAGTRLADSLIEKHQFDVINTWFAVPSGLVGGRVAKRHNIPHLLTVIGGDIYDPSKWYSPHSFYPSSAAVKWAIKRADALVAISSDIANRTREYFQYKPEIPVISLGIKDPDYVPKNRIELGLDPSNKYIVTLGRHVRRKDYPTLLKAIAKLDRDDVKLLMIGDGPEQGNLKNLASELDVSEHVHFKGFLSQEEKCQTLAASDLFVLASLHEGFGVVYLEAMYCGLPVIAASEGGQTDLLDNGKTGFLVPIGDVDQMCEALSKVISDDELAAQMSAHNQQHIQNFSIAKLSSKYVSVYSSLVQR